MRVDAFDFHLPEEAIALRPVEPRDAARMLCVTPGGSPELADESVRDLPGLLRPGDAMVFNDTRVIPARLHGVRLRGDIRARVEVLLHKREGEDGWVVFARPARKLQPGDRVVFGSELAGETCALDRIEAVVERSAEQTGEAGQVLLRFSLAGPALDDAIVRQGELPLPPYIAGKRATDARDASDYQTIYAKHEGAVAAPTAGLHFTDELFARLDAAGIERHFVTLHVGAGTFLPVKADNTADHRMHAEWGRVSSRTAQQLNAVKARGGRIVSVGTTSLRLLESAALPDGRIAPFSGDTSIFITPGYRFRAVDMLMTNFHLPRSTLFMLVSAFCGLERMQAAYAHAVASGYRFYSYGDASLLTRDDSVAGTGR
jgi:S-adenosylmethionine:tRNA ribosyltransferase-isomerase